mgnify:CR=1 FL=1
MALVRSPVQSTTYNEDMFAGAYPRKTRHGDLKRMPWLHFVCPIRHCGTAEQPGIVPMVHSPCFSMFLRRGHSCPMIWRTGYHR